MNVENFAYDGRLGGVKVVAMTDPDKMVMAGDKWYGRGRVEETACE